MCPPPLTGAEAKEWRRRKRPADREPVGRPLPHADGVRQDLRRRDRPDRGLLPHTASTCSLAGVETMAARARRTAPHETDAERASRTSSGSPHQLLARREGDSSAMRRLVDLRPDLRRHRPVSRPSVTATLSAVADVLDHQPEPVDHPEAPRRKRVHELRRAPGQEGPVPAPREEQPGRDHADSPPRWSSASTASPHAASAAPPTDTAIGPEPRAPAPRPAARRAPSRPAPAGSPARPGARRPRAPPGSTTRPAGPATTAPAPRRRPPGSSRPAAARRTAPRSPPDWGPAARRRPAPAPGPARSPPPTGDPTVSGVERRRQQREDHQVPGRVDRRLLRGTPRP